MEAQFLRRIELDFAVKNLFVTNCGPWAPTLLPVLDLQVRLDFLKLHLRINGADVGVLVERVADDQGLHTVLEL